MTTLNRHFQLSIEHEKAARESITLARFNDYNLLPQREPVTVPDDGLWKGLWNHSELACLFGEPNVGKTILAMQIAVNVKRMGLNVEYFDLEDFEHPVMPQFTATTMPTDDDETTPLEFISKKIAVKKTQVAIIDNFDILLNGDNSSAAAKHALNALRQLARQSSTAILIIAHSKPTKRNRVITTECLPHAYEIMHACDSVFSLAKANRHNATCHRRTHYIKQHKNRMAPVIYDDNCVLTAMIDLHDGIIEFSNFEPMGNERQLLRDYGFHSSQSVYEAIRKLNYCHYTTREIAAIVGMSQSQVSRIIKRELPDDIEPEVAKCEQLLEHNFRQEAIKQYEQARLNPQAPLPHKPSHDSNPSDAFDAFDSTNESSATEPSDAFDSTNVTRPRFNTASSVKKLMKKSRHHHSATAQTT